MALGKFGTGPYGRIRHLQNEINGYKYELRLIKEGVKAFRGKSALEQMIEERRRTIRRIKSGLKKKKEASAS